jgi:oligopeptide transport system permease protein
MTPATPVAPAPAEPGTIIPGKVERGTSLWKDAWHRLKKNRVALFGLWAFGVVAFTCLVGPFFTGYSYEETEISLKASAPMEPVFVRAETHRAGEVWRSYIALSNLEDEFLDRPKEDRRGIIQSIDSGHIYREGSISYERSNQRHLLGTDPLGRDLLTRILIGGRISLAVGCAATLVSVVIGVLWGAVAGFVGGVTDTAMMRIVDVLFALPFTVIVILLMVMFGRNFILLFVAIGCVQWLTMARIVRGQIISLKNQEFIEAAVSLGLPAHWILLRHLIPNVLGSIIIYATLTFPEVMLLEAVLSFLGLGVQPPLSSWGVLIEEGSRTMESSIWLLAFPAAFFSLTLFSLNFLGDGLRDALDPKSSRE